MAAPTPAFRLLSRRPLLRTTSYKPRLTHRPKHTTATTAAPETPSTTRTAAEFEQNTHRTSNSIPGPSWLWLEPVVQPFRAYGAAQRRRPYLVQWLSSITIYYLGDLSAQKVMQEPDTSDAETGSWYDTGRALRAVTIGAVSSIPAYRWFLWLGESFNYRSKVVSLATKVAVNQALFTPLFNTYFFGMQSLLSGASAGEAVERVRNTVPTSWWNSCKVWPAITAFSFAVVPIEYRSIFAGVIAIGWQTYLSMLNQRAAQAELEAQERDSNRSKSATSTETTKVANDVTHGRATA